MVVIACSVSLMFNTQWGKKTIYKEPLFPDTEYGLMLIKLTLKTRWLTKL